MTTANFILDNTINSIENAFLNAIRKRNGFSVLVNRYQYKDGFNQYPINNAEDLENCDICTPFEVVASHATENATGEQAISVADFSIHDEYAEEFDNEYILTLTEEQVGSIRKQLTFIFEDTLKLECAYDFKQLREKLAENIKGSQLMRFDLGDGFKCHHNRLVCQNIELVVSRHSKAIRLIFNVATFSELSTGYICFDFDHEELFETLGLTIPF